MISLRSDLSQNFHFQRKIRSCRAFFKEKTADNRFVIPFLSPLRRKNAQQGIAYINQDITTARDAMKDATGSERAELSSKINTLNEEKTMMARLAEL